MRVRLVRALLLPLLVLGVSAYAVQRASEPPPTTAAPPAGAGLPEPVGLLWSAWGEDLTSGDGGLPQELALLDAEEAVYVLLSVRAAQVTQAVDVAGPGADVDEALQAAGLAPQPPEVPATAVPDQPGCVVLTYADEPFGRSYFGWAQAPAEAGPEPTSALEAVLLRTARVGLGPTDTATCGAGSAYSRPAQDALRALDPALLG